MTERKTALWLAVGALALFYLLFIGSPSGFAEDDTPRPTTAEVHGNGYAAARAWLERNGVLAKSWRERYTELPRAASTASGNLLIVTLPTVDRFRTEEFLPLDRWVRAGNTLLVLAALTDTPDWAGRAKSFSLGDIESLTGLEFKNASQTADEEVAEDEAADAAIAAAEAEASAADDDSGLRETLEQLARVEPIDIEIVPRGAHPLSQGVRRLVAKSDAPAQPWPLQLPLDDFAFTLAGLGDQNEGVLFVRSHGDGRIIVSTAASLFSNRALAEADNARLLANIVAYAVSPKGLVLFDDLRQGLSANYNPARFWSDTRVHWTIAVIVALWFVWVLGGTRLPRPAAAPAAPDEVALVRATGGLLARIARPQAGALQLIEQFLQRVGRAGAVPNEGVDEWARLAAHPRIDPADTAKLREWRAAAAAGKRVPLVDLQRTLLRVERLIVGTS